MQTASTCTSGYSKKASAQLLKDILAFDQQVQSSTTFALRYLKVAEFAHGLLSTSAGNHPSQPDMLLSPSEYDSFLIIDQMLDLIETQLLMGINYVQWAKYETSHGKQGIGLTLKEHYIERKEIKRNIVALLSAIDCNDPVAQCLKRVCPEPSKMAYQSLAASIEDASNQYPLNPWRMCLLGQILLGYKTRAKDQEASECFLHAVLLLPSCSSRAQKVILLKSVLRYCCL